MNIEIKTDANGEVSVNNKALGIRFFESPRIDGKLFYYLESTGNKVVTKTERFTEHSKRVQYVADLLRYMVRCRNFSL